MQKAKDWLIAGLAVGLVAGAATAPFAIQHFNRVSIYGLPANLLLEPLSSFVIMPALALGSVAQLFGVGGPLLALAGWGIQQMLALARPDGGLCAGRHDHRAVGAQHRPADSLHRHPVAVPVARAAALAGAAPGPQR